MSSNARCRGRRTEGKSRSTSQYVLLRYVVGVAAVAVAAVAVATVAVAVATVAVATLESVAHKYKVMS